MIHKWFLWLTCLAGGGVEALSLHQRDKPAIVKIPVQRVENVATRLQKRISTVSAPFEVQEIQVRLDTSSGYLAITASNSNYCESTNEEAYFNISSFSTYQVLDHDFNATYYQDHILTGDFAHEKVAINGAIIPAMELGVNFGIDGDNVLGLENLVGRESDAPARILQALMKTGDIKSAAYSLWMDDSIGTIGSIPFGGVNTAKYVGEHAYHVYSSYQRRPPSPRSPGDRDCNSSRRCLQEHDIRFTFLRGSGLGGVMDISPRWGYRTDL
ncbi:hypothetical protein DTO013E5_9384 [Penicillium roqueforti]|uniref:uncharacterized protein n=1 Tax=Penicillium roqueforti TaxID=5082 RepID=UPI00190AECE3|nr:uncharacterized protein LCP9604111_9571 [Penicillium roqueforti]KAF9238159.1 hypothetical protein LCP9604111_9571 [Penicillium roqueforti]KAI1830162.1 hypothetical protein CBS147337_9080 [Penicillium roqueforti]KAI2672367.1 hypothetical protein CBS147355_8087 [Penicillium roqueforti]KAI2675699.1 hypothetical protein LCP963914a_8536 [Penicillium roqueforti]KAI2694966.1 hypothetical protein CBS147372_9440 [Penicillium roqueforti]